MGRYILETRIADRGPWFALANYSNSWEAIVQLDELLREGFYTIQDLRIIQEEKACH